MCTMILSEVLLDSPTKDKKIIAKTVGKKNIWNNYTVRHTLVEHTPFSTAKHTLKAEEMQITEAAAAADVL